MHAAAVSALLGVLSLSLWAGEPSVRREGAAFHISGVRSAEEIAIYTAEGDVPPVLGSVRADGDSYVFTPRYAIPASVACRVVAGGRTFHFPAVAETRPAVAFVQHIYPTSSRIPANQLKFYIHFSHAMRPGDAWRNLRLRDAEGKLVELAFLEIDQELWDRDARRLTVLFDPGRIKRGVLPRDEVGAALVEGARYTLEVDGAWRDAEGAPLRRPARKAFTVVAEDRTAIDPAAWKLHAPKGFTREPLRIAFGEPLDAALALRLITLPGIAGTARLVQDETVWEYHPDEPWAAETVRVVVDSALEDLAGNKVGRPFDVDTFERVTRRVERTPVELTVRIR